MSTDLVSIITPYYKAHKTIKTTIDSVLQQSYSNWELLIIDDCSNDGIVDIIAEINDTRIQLLKTDENSGPGAARNVGINAAKGRFIAFLDSDDLWLNNKLQEQIGFLLINNAAAVCSSYEMFDLATNRFLRKITVPRFATYKTLAFGNSVPCLTGIYDTIVVGKILQPSNRFYASYEDYIMWTNLTKAGHVILGINQVHARYAVVPNSLSANKLKMARLMWHYQVVIRKNNYVKAFYNLLRYAFSRFLKHRL